ncbi:MAG TPA: glycosyltransferase [Acidiferrobacter sp.]|nr:glycosyltransferase [Acidiferrobacter sp.]
MRTISGSDSMVPTKGEDMPQPLVSMLLIAYDQERFVEEAIRGALSQTYKHLEIIISDDASSDGTFATIEDALRNYSGPHRIIVRRNETNIGIGGHLSLLAQLAHGELLVVAAGDDVSAAERCEALVNHWIAHGRTPDLIASDLMDMDAVGNIYGRIAPTVLDGYKEFDDWAAHRPWVVGASHAWTRRLFDRFGAMMANLAAEDQVMTLRAILTGGAVSLSCPLVNYRRGGLSGKRLFRSVDDKVAQIRRSNYVGLVELAQLQKDADVAGIGGRMQSLLAPRLARERFTQAVFEPTGVGRRIAAAWRAHDVGSGHRARMLFYSICPMVYVPLFFLKKILGKSRGAAP